MTEYVALQGLMAPGTNVFGYRRGDPVGEAVVESWGLVLGEHVAEGTELPADAVPGTPVRPDEAGTRGEWEAWAVANGMSAEDAARVSQDDLEAVQAAEEPAPAARPADNAPKAEWVTYAIGQGADETWARDSATTKANLQAYEPVGDPVAIAATEANQG